MNLYPIWNNLSHGPACGAHELADYCAAGQEPLDVVAFIEGDTKNLVARLRALGWDQVADYLEGAGQF